MFGLCLLVCSQPAFAQTFVHPGALNSQADFDRIKAKVAAGEWPWYDSYQTLCNDGLSSLNWWWGPVDQIHRGGGSANNYSRSQKDALAIYCLALRYRISGDTRYAEKAIEGMDRWSSTMTAGPNGNNWGLAAGLCGYEFAVAGETLRGYPGWSQASIDRYKGFLWFFAHENVDWLNMASVNSRSNWFTDNVASLAACGVFCDNADWFNQAINYYKYGRGNAQVHLWGWYLHPEGIVQMEESGRDSAHTQDAISSMAALCEIADHQGIDLYGYDNNRFLRGAEYFAKYNSGLDVPYTAYYNNGPYPGGHWETNIGWRGAYQPVWEMLNAHYYKQGICAPYTARFAAGVRPSGNVGNWNSPDVFGYDTLTHYQEPPATDLPPSGLLVNFNARQATLSWFGSPRATSYNLKRSGTKGGPYTTIATTNAMTTNYVDDSLPRGQTYYYVVSAVTPSGETANSPESIGGCVTRYDFEGDANDSIGTFHGTLACNGSSGLPGFTGGHGGGQAISLNGVNQYVQLPLGSLTHQDITISAWIKWSGGNIWQRIFDSGDTNHNRNIYLSVSDGAHMKFYMSDGWHDYDANLYGPIPALNTWTHVAVTVKGDTATLYENGVAVDSQSGRTCPLFGQTYTYIGRSQWGNDPYFNGAIDDFRVYNTALSSAEIYAMGYTGSNHAPQFTSDPLQYPTATEGVSYVQSLCAKTTDVDGGNLTFTKISGPGWLNVAPNGALTGTPWRGDVGVNRFNIRVTDSAGASDETTLYISVKNTNWAPTWNSSTITAPSVTRNEPYSATLVGSATDADIVYGDSITFSKVSGPSWLTVASNGALSGTPQGSDAGLNSFSVRVTDASGLYADATLNINVLPYALRSQYSFDGNLNDSVNGYNGTAAGSPAYVPGAIGQAISLNGSTDSVSLPGAAINYKQITVAAWVYWNGGYMWQRIFDFGNDTNHYLFLTPFGADGIRFAIKNGGSEQVLGPGWALSSNSWNHVAVTLTGSSATMYVNGSQVATSTGITIRPSDFAPSLNYLGRSQFSSDPLFAGKIDDFRIYNYALSATEIANLVAIAPAAPTGLSATGGNGASGVTLSWSPSGGATSYNVKRATSPDGTYTIIYTGGATAFTDTTGTPGTTYYYVVTAVNSLGESPVSSAVSQFANFNLPQTDLRMDESSGTVAADSSGNGWNGTLVNGASWAAGKLNNAVSLSASSSVSLPSGILAGGTDFTVSAWVKVNSSTANQRIFDFGTSTVPGASVGAYMFLTPNNGAGHVRWAITTAGYNNEQSIQGPSAIATGTWTHVAVTLSGHVGTLYVNGVASGTNTSLTLTPSSLGITTNNFIGKSQYSGDLTLQGSVDEFMVFRRALSGAEIAALATPPSAPASLNVIPGNNQATLTWSSVAGATGYNLKRSGTSGGPYAVLQANLSGTTFIDTGLLNTAGYYYVVTALNGAAESANSSEAATSPVGPPPVPANLQVSATISQVSLTWTASYGAASYNVYRSVTSGSGYALTGSSASASYVDSSVTNGITYFYEVSAVGAGTNGESAPSTEASAMPQGLPAAPTGLTATGSNGSVILTWTASPSATSYNVMSTTTSGSNYTVVATTGSTSYVDTGLTNGAPVYYVVSAQNAMGEGSDSPEVSATPIAPPAAPTLTITSGNALVGIQWSSSSGANSYTLKRSGTSGGPYSVLTTGTATSYQDTSVTNGASYYYVVTASNAGGDSSSAEAAAYPNSRLLRAYLKCDEQSGGTAWDSSGNGWNATLTGGNTWAAGRINNAVSFSGNTNYASLPNGVMSGVTDFTVATWVKLNASNNTRIFDFGTGTAAYMELCPKNSSNSYLRYEIVVGGTVQQINTTYTFQTGVWTHVALTQSGSTGSLYVNGSLVGSNPALTLTPAALGATTLNYIGKSQWSGDYYLNGLIDEFQIYGRALTTSELGSLANPLAAPSNLTATAGYSQITCSWNSVAGAASYNLKRAYVSGGPYTQLATLTGTTYTDSPTVPESPYYYVVTSGSGLVESANSAQATATPLMTAPVVSSTTAASGTNGIAFKYQIAASNYPTSYSASGLPAGLNVSSTTGLISGTPSVSGTFTASIGATNDGGTGNASLTITLQPAAPAITSGLSKTGTSGSAFSYSIAASNGPVSFAASGLPAGLSVDSATGVISGTPSATGSFSIALSASNGGGTGSATLNLLVISGSFGAPTGMSASGGNTTVSLTWNPVAGASSYTVKRLVSGSTYTVVVSGLASLSYTDTGRTNRTSYTYVVSAVDSSSTESADSSSVVATPMPPDIWTGSGSDSYWQTSANWSSLPAAGDPLFFEGSQQLGNNNNYPANTQFGGITFNSSAGGFWLYGNAINLAGDIVNNSTSSQNINLALVLTGTAGTMTTINTASGDIGIAGSIAQTGGNCGLIKTGNGSLSLSGSNSFAGGVTLLAGYLGAENHSALGSGTLTLAGGTLRNLNSGTRILANPVAVAAGTTSYVRAIATDLVLNGKLTGTGTLDLAGTYNVSGLRLSGSNSGFVGTVKITGPNVRLDSPNSTSANAAWVVGVNGTGGMQLNAPGTANTFPLGSLSGNGCIMGHYYFTSSQVQTVSVGALGTDTTFDGTIVDNAVSNPAYGNIDSAANNVLALNKVGAGTLTLTGNSSYSGPTTINAGTLKLTGNLNGTGAVTVANGATLAGTGNIAGSLSLAGGGTISPGNAGTGSLSVSGSLSLVDGSALNLDMSGTANSDKVLVGAGVAASGTTTLNFNTVAGFGGGMFPVIVSSGSLDAGNFAAGSVPSGYSCSLSASNGVLYANLLVAPSATTGLAAVAGDQSVSLSWDANPMAASYNVKRSLTSGSGFVTVGSSATNSFTDNSGLTNGVTYFYVVSAVNFVGEGINSSQASARPLPPAPVISSSPSATGTIGVAFSYAIAASSSPVSYAASGLPSGLAFNASSGIISGTPAVTGSFGVLISAINLGGTGSATLALTVLPQAPAITSAGAVTGTNGVAFSYQIAASNNPTSFGATGLPPGLSVNAANGLISGTPSVAGSFSATISASNAGGTGSASLGITIQEWAPSAPTGVTAAGGNAVVNLSWNAAPRATAYNVKRSLSSGTGYQTLASGVMATSYSDSNVTNGTRYYYVVSATNSVGESPDSVEVSATPRNQVTWTGGGADNNWQTPANWTALPNAGDSLNFAGSTRLTSTNNYPSNTAFGGVVFSSGGGAFVLGGNSITLLGDIVNNSASAQSLNLPMVLSGYNPAINTATGNISLTKAISESGGSFGLTKTGSNALTLSGSSTFTGGVALVSGTISVTLTSGTSYGPLGTGTFSLSGGSLNNNGATAGATIGNPIAITGTGGVIAVTASQNMQLDGRLSGTGNLRVGDGTASMSLYLNGTNAMTSGTVTFANNSNSIRIANPSFGSASVAWVFNNTSANRETFDFGAGTIFFGSISGAGVLQGNNAGSTKTMSVGALGYNDTFSGIIQDGGGVVALVKTGTGTLTLSSANSYTGGSTVNGGTLNITGSLTGAGGVVVNNGGTLAGSGSIAGLTTVASGGAIAPGNGGLGALSVASLALNPGAALNLELSGTGNSDRVKVGAGLSASGTTLLNLTALGGFGAGTYPLVTGTAAISASNFAVGSAPAGYSYVLSASSGTLVLTVAVLPSIPTGLTATAGDASVTLSWNSSSGAASYSLKRTTTSGTGYVTVASGTATNYEDNTGLTNGTTYYYVVSAVNGALDSGNSSEVSARPSGPFTWGEQSGSKIGLSPDGQGNTVASLTVPASILGHTYQLQYSATLASGSWTNIGSPVTGTGGQIVISAITDPSARKGFFRLLITR
jgi:autotransporter-associated beta strand protein